MMVIQKLKNVEWSPKYMVYIAPILMMSMMINQFMNLKAVDLFGIPILASILTYPISMIVCDILTEVYGFKRTRRLIYVCLAMVVATMLFIQLAVYMPPAPEYTKNDVFKDFFGQLPRMALASIAGYLTGELINSAIMARLKSKTDGKFFIFRALTSTGISQIISTIVFFVIGFWGNISLTLMFSSIATGAGLTLVYETLVLPLTYRCAQYLKKLEGVDYFD